MKTVQLKPLSSAHTKWVMKWVNDPTVTMYFANNQKHISVAEEREFLRELVKSPYDKAYSVFATDMDRYGTYIGQVSINQIHWQSGEGRMFIAVIPEFHGLGYAHAVIKEVQRIAFDVWKLHRLFLIVRYENKKAVQLYTECGFRQEGVMYDKYKVGDTYYDMVQMAILKPWYERWWKHMKE